MYKNVTIKTMYSESFLKTQGLDINAIEFIPINILEIIENNNENEPISFDEKIILDNLIFDLDEFHEFHDFEREYIDNNTWLFDFCPFSGFSISDKKINLI
jgi:hypothetical protein